MFCVFELHVILAEFVSLLLHCSTNSLLNSFSLPCINFLKALHDYLLCVVITFTKEHFNKLKPCRNIHIFYHR